MGGGGGNIFVGLPRGLPFSTYAPRGPGGVKPPIQFHCELHAKRGWVGPDSMYNCVRTKWKAPKRHCNTTHTKYQFKCEKRILEYR